MKPLPLSERKPQPQSRLAVTGNGARQYSPHGSGTPMEARAPSVIHSRRQHRVPQPDDKTDRCVLTSHERPCGGAGLFKKPWKKKRPSGVFENGRNL